jgi:hypothetical protein
MTLLYVFHNIFHYSYWIYYEQVTMEEQMMMGCLELLNDEAKEDAQKGEDSSSTLSPINSEPGKNILITTIKMWCSYIHYSCHFFVTEPQQHQRRKSSKAYLSQDETDVLYVIGTSLNVTAELPDSPSVVRKLGESAEAKYSLINESYLGSAKNIAGGSGIGTSEPISIPGKSPGRKRRTGSSLSKNLSFSESVTMMSSSPLKSHSLGAKDYNSKLYIQQQQQQQRSSKSPGKERKVSKSFAAHMEKQGQERSSSDDDSSDESQKPLVMKAIPGDKYRKVYKLVLLSILKTLNLFFL